MYLLACWAQQMDQGLQPRPTPLHPRRQSPLSYRPRHQEISLSIFLTACPSGLARPTALGTDIYPSCPDLTSGILRIRSQPLQHKFFLFTQSRSTFCLAGRAASGQLASHKPPQGLGAEGNFVFMEVKFTCHKIHHLNHLAVNNLHEF